MLIQGPTSDPKCELNITSFFTLPHPLHYPHLCQGYHGHCIVTLSDGAMGRLGVGSFMLGFGLSCFFYFLFCFCAVVGCSFMAGT